MAAPKFTSEIHTKKKFSLGKIVRSTSDREYIYLEGVASTVVGSVVTFGLTGTNAFQTALSVTGATGPVAFAMAAVLAGQYGWYQVRGATSVNFAGAAVAGKTVYSAGTGTADDAVVAGDMITGAIVAATVGGAGLGSVFCNHPFMNHLG